MTEWKTLVWVGAGILALRMLWFLKPLVQDLASDLHAPMARKAERVHTELRQLVRASSPDSEVWQFAEMSSHPPSVLSVAFWVITGTDVERDRLAADQGLKAAFEALLTARRLAPDAVPLGFQSRETAGRDFEGDWSKALGRSQEED